MNDTKQHPSIAKYREYAQDRITRAQTSIVACGVSLEVTDKRKRGVIEDLHVLKGQHQSTLDDASATLGDLDRLEAIEPAITEINKKIAALVMARAQAYGAARLSGTMCDCLLRSPGVPHAQISIRLGY